MKIRVIAVALVLFALCGRANAFIFDNWYYSESSCASYVPQTPPMAAGKAFCLDSTARAFYVWNGTAFVAPSSVVTTLSATSATFTGTTDRTVSLTNGGHLNSQLGTATIPTTSSCGTNTVTATSTDTAFQVAAGAVTACTVIFNTAYTAQPVCTCSDNTTAAGLKVAYSTGVNITVSGLTSGDTFGCVCIGH